MKTKLTENWNPAPSKAGLFKCARHGR